MAPKLDADLSALHKEAVETSFVTVTLSDAGKTDMQQKMAKVMKKNKKLGAASCGDCRCS